MALNFPNNPLPGDLHTDPSNDVEYVYDDIKNSWSMTGRGGTTIFNVYGPQAQNPN